MTCYIVDRKANNFNKTSGFVVTIAVAAYGSFRVYTLFASMFFVPCLLCLYLLCLGKLFACLCLPWLILFMSAIYTVYVYYVLVSCLLDLNLP